MSRLSLTLLLLVLSSPVLSAQSEPTIPFLVYEYKDPNSNEEPTLWIDMAQIPGGLAPKVTTAIRGVAHSAVKTAVEEAQAATCPAVVDGSVTVSLNLDLISDKLGIGVGSGLSITFECKGGVAVRSDKP